MVRAALTAAVSTKGGGFTGLPAAFDSHHSDSLRAFCRFVMFV